MSASSSSLTTKDYLCALLVVVLWGFNFVPTKFALESFTPFQLGAARYLLVAFPLIFVIARPPIPFFWVLAFALSQGVGQFGLLFFALQSGMTTALGSVIMQTQLFFTALMGVTLLGEKIPNSLKAGLVLAGAGLICFAVSMSDQTSLSRVTPLGFFLTLSAASMWATSNILIKRMQGMGMDFKPLPLLVWSGVISGAVFIAMSILFDPPQTRWQWLDSTPRQVACVFYLGWMASGLAYWLWASLLTRHPASKIAPFSLGIPVIGLFAGIFILSEEVSRLQWIGTDLIICSLAFVMVSTNHAIRRMSQRYRPKRKRAVKNAEGKEH